ncbi:hypothetical protein HK104_011464 [Borealophlyctis nickersoniae]|nr:hypothetical protein HK104_011464 [Borealophlyctis nickersoniae]
MIELSGALYDSYLRYKRGTDTVVTHILAAAASVLTPEELEKITGGTNKPTPDTAPAPVAAKRLKGRARKLAKENAAASSEPTAPTQPRRVLQQVNLSATQLAQLLRALAKTPEKVAHLPAKILAVFKNVLDLRKRFGGCYAAGTATLTGPERGEHELKNSTHQHYLRLLESAYVLFGGPDAEREQRKENYQPMVKASEKETVDEDLLKLKNKFEVLEVGAQEEEDGTESDEEDGAGWVTEEEEEDEESEEEDDFATTFMETVMEAVFASWCLSEDMKRLRRFLKETWIKYNLGRLTIVTVSVLMSLAVELVKSAEKNLAEMCMGSSYQMWMTLLMVFHSRGLTEVQPGSAAAQELTDTFMMHIFELKISSRMISGDNLAYVSPEALEAFGGRWNPLADRSKMTSEGRAMEDSALFCEQFPEWVFVAQMCRDGAFGQDALLELYFDSTHLMRRKLKPTLTMVRDYAKRVVASIDPYLANDPKDSNNAPIQTNAFAIRQNVYYNLVEDYMEVSWKTIARNRQKWAPPKTTGPYSLLLNSPWLCAASLAQNQANYYFVGKQAISYGGFFLVTMHVYNAYRQLDRIQPLPLFEMFMEVFGQRLFNGNVPTKAEDFYKSLRLSLGLSAASFARDVRKRGASGLGSTKSPKGGRIIIPDDDSLTYNMLHAKHLDQKFSPEMLNKYLDKTSGSGNNNNNNWDADDEEDDDIPSFISMLEAVTEIVEREQKQTYKFGLDFLRIHSHCHMMMRTLYLEVPFLKTVLGPGEIRDDGTVTRIAKCLLMLLIARPEYKAESEGLTQKCAKRFFELASELKEEDVFMIPGVKLRSEP